MLCNFLESVSKMYPTSMGVDIQNSVFLRPILLSRKKATGPEDAAPRAKRGPIQSTAESLTSGKSQLP